jgi:hypothetical protein
MKPVWTRLIRFLSTDGKIYHGEPLAAASELDLGRVTEKDGLKAKVIEGSDLFDTTGETKVTEKTVDVKEILGPLTRADVPVIRCIGLNYAKHSMFNHFLSRYMREREQLESHTSPKHIDLMLSNRNKYLFLILIAHNFAVREAGRKPPPFPSLFFKPTTCIHDHGAPIVIPKIAQDDQADYEGELVCWCYIIQANLC